MGRLRMKPDDVIIRMALAEGEFRGLYRFEDSGGITIRGTLARTRRSQNDLVQLFEDISNAIEVEALRLTEERLKNNPRDRSYPFRRVGRGPTQAYRNSFQTSVSRRVGRPAVTVRNTSASARYVEDGNDGAGRYIKPRRASVLTIPLKESVGSELWKAGKPGGNPKVRRVSEKNARRAGIRPGRVRGQSGSYAVYRKSSGNYFLLLPRVETFEGYNIMEDALLLGLPKGIANFNRRR